MRCEDEQVFALTSLADNKLRDAVLEDAGDQIEGVIVIFRSRIGSNQQHTWNNPVTLRGGATILQKRARGYTCKWK